MLTLSSGYLALFECV